MTVETHSDDSKYVYSEELKQQNVKKLDQDNVNRSVDHPDFRNLTEKSENPYEA
jgi:hypothetical protein